MRGLRAIALAIVVVLVTSLSWVRTTALASAAPPASADQDVQDIWNGLDALQSFSQGLATDGLFGQPLTDVALTPGSADGIGFGDLLQKLVIDRLDSAGPLHLADVVNALKTTSPISLTNGRSATVGLTSSGAGVESLAFDIRVTRQVAAAPMSLNITSPRFAFSAPVQVDLVFHATFTLKYDTSARTVYVDTGTAAPALTLTADAHFPCTAANPSPPPACTTQNTTAVHAGIGVLGVSLTSGSSFDLTTSLTASLRDPNSDGKVTLGTFAVGVFNPFSEPNGGGGVNPGELAGGAASAAGMVDVKFDVNPGELHAQLNITASVDPALPSVTLPSVNANVNIDWAPITTGSPTVAVTGGGLATVQSFENLSPRDLAQGLARLATALEGIQMSRTYSPTSGGKTGTTAAMVDGDNASTYTVVSGGAPAVGDFFQIGSGAGAPVRSVDKVENGGPYKLTFNSPVNADVAAGTTLTQVDARGNIDLPFMKGTLADVFQANEAIVAFLTKHVQQKYNSLAGGRSGTLSGVVGQTASYAVVQGGAPQNGDYYQIGADTKKVAAVSGTGPYSLTFDTAFSPAPANGTAAVQVQLGDTVPDFSSLQSMLVELKNEAGLPGGSSFSIGAVSYDAGTSKLSLGLGFARTQGSANDLDPFTAVDNGTGTFGTDTATGNPNLADASKGWQPNFYAGHLVKAGGSSNVVKSNDATTLVFNGPWHGTAPTNGTTYQVGGQDPQTGAVSFANKLNELASGSGIINANAQIPVATVKPSYAVNLTLVLDLQAPKTGASCTGMPFNGAVNSQACPFTANNTDGSSTVVTELPTAADRVLLRTVDSGGQPAHLLTADAPIQSQVDINANVGFLGLHLTGTLDECAHFSSGTTCPDSATATDHLLSIDFASALGDAQHDIPLSSVFSALARDPKSLVGVHVKGQVKATITPDVPGFNDFFGGSPPQFSLSLPDVTDPASATFDATGFTGALDKIKAFNFDTDNPKALFGEILQTLKTLSKTLKNAGGNGNSEIAKVLGTKIPAVGIKLGDVFNSSEQGQGANVTYTDTTLTDTDAHFTDDLLLRTVVSGTSTAMIVQPITATTLTLKFWQGGTPTPGTQYSVQNGLDSAIDLLTANPADSLQSLVGLLNQRLGASSIPITFSVDTSGATPTLALAIDWKRDFHFTTPVAFDFKLGSDSDSIVGTQAKGLVKLHANAEAKVKLLLPMSIAAEDGATDAGGLQIDPANTSLSAGLDGEAAGYLKANLGPLNLSFGKPVDTPQAGGDHPAEAHATFKASLASTDTAPESISAFLTNIVAGGIQFNQGATGQACAGDATPNLALCAALPVYLSTNGGQSYAPVNATGPADPPDTLRLRLPLTGSLTNEFALTDSGGNILHVDASNNATPLRLDIPPTLLTDLANAVLDFSQLGQGLDGYFRFAEQSLNLASFGGKLPLIGKDLQQGAQFLEQVQTEIDSKLGALASVTNEQGLKNWITNELESALAPVLPTGSHVVPDFVCSALLDTPTNVQGTAALAGAGSTNYQYRVSATDPKGETVASAATTVASQALSAANTVALTWNKVDGADGYKVYRSADGGATWARFDAPQATNPTFSDSGAAGTTAAPTSTSNPQKDPCDIADITGVTLTADIGQGSVTANEGCVDNGASTCITGLKTPLDIGIPGLSISAANQDDGTPDPANEVQVKLGWRIHLKIGLDKNRGFFIETQDKADPEIALGVAVSLPQSIQANIAFLKINLCDFATGQTYPPAATPSCPFKPLVPNGVTRTAAGPTPLFAGMFGLDLHTKNAATAFDPTPITPNDDPANDITLSDLSNASELKNLVTVGLSAKVHIDWDFQAIADAALPGIGGEFKLDWSWGVTTGKPAVATETGDDATPPTTGDGAPDIQFDNVYITAGGFLSGVLKPIVKEVKSFTSPLKPVIDTLYAPIPVLSDLSHLAGGGDVTLITIAEAFSTLAGGPDLTLVERLLEVVKLINAIPDGDDNLGIFIGTFHVSGKAINTAATPDNSGSLIDQTPGKQPVPAPDSQNGGQNASGAMNSASNNAVSTGSSKAGFSFPILENPASIFNLLMGGDIDLIRFDSGNLSLGFTYSQQFGPVYAPPPVLITISGSASVTARIIAGFDTYGLRKGFEAIKSGQRASTVVLSVIDSLFLYTVDPTKNDGKPVPVLTLRGELAAGAEVSVVIVTVGVEGGISLTINFYWNDPDNDGKFRASEFVAAAFANPLCLFNTEGELDVFLRVFVTIGIGPFSTTFSFTLVNIKLLDFSFHPDCSPPPPELGEVQGHTLYLFFGALGHNAQRGEPWGNDSGSNAGADETVKVHELHDEAGAFSGFAVDGLTRHEEFLDDSITTVVVDGRGYQGKEEVVITGDSNQSQKVSSGPPTPRPFDKTAIVFGGNNDDTIKIDGGTAHVDGGFGNDVINLANGNDKVAGGPGNDNITVGNGNDTIAGDSSLSITGSATLADHRQIDTDNPPHGSWVAVANVPNAVGAPGTFEFPFLDGADSILVGFGANTIYGNGGDDSINVATDKPLTGSETTQLGVNAAKGQTIVGGTGNNHIHGGSGGDTIYAGQQWAVASDIADPANASGNALDGTNQVDTSTGKDTVFGGSGVDIVVGHSTGANFDTFYGAGNDDVLLAGDSTDKLYGGPGNDYLSGGPAKIDPLNPTDAVLGAWRVTAQPDGNAQGQKLLVGGDGRDHIYGTDGGNSIFGDRQEDTCALPSSGPRSKPPSETNSGSPGDDYIIGGIGIDTVSAGGGNDYADGRAANDLLCGGAGGDQLLGGTGNDNAFGGTDIDLMLGGDGNDNLYGNDQNDTIFGGNDTDFIEGNNGTDWASGDDGTDTVIGGTSAAASLDQGDFLYGGNQNDTIVGDNAVLSSGNWIPADHAVAPSTLGGADLVFAGNDDDTCYGGIDDDLIFGGSGNDHCEGNEGADTINGEAGEDELIGGGSLRPSAGVGYTDGVDTINGGTDNDVITGDNAIVTTVAAGSSTDTVEGRGFVNGHTIQLLDLGYTPAAANSAGDVLHGNEGNDVMYGQGGSDAINGDANDDYAEGGPAQDTIAGDAGNDDLVGGSSTVDHGANAGRVGQPDAGDIINGNDDSDVVIGDNGKVLRDPAATPSPLTNRPGMTPQRAIVLYDLSNSNATASAFGDDLVNGDNGVDVILGQGGTDRLKGNADDDYVEGDQDSDFIEGDTGGDDLVGGSSTVQSGTGVAAKGQDDTADAIYGAPGDDVITGDNALVLRNNGRTSTTDRLGTAAAGTRLVARTITLYDLNGSSSLATPNASQFGDDRVSGGSGNDVEYGQDGMDQMSGGPNADYIEGNGGDDTERGDVRLDQAPTTVGEALTTPLVVAWPGTASAFGDLEGAGPDGQDDMIGGSALPNFRDGNDNLAGDGESDFQLGDNGTLKRDLQGADGVATERVYVQRYPDGPLPANAAVVRLADPAVVNANGTTRFCTTAQATCEKNGAFGADTMFGDGGDDTMWGQDGNDTMRGGTENDDMYGELGDDVIFGDDGDDAILGDRGGIVDELMNPSDIAKQVTVSLNNPPQETFVVRRQGTLDHRVDLLHDINGDGFVGTSKAVAMAHPGLNEGGNDRIRGGNGQDNIHAGFDDDLANGDSGGDIVFGDDGADVLWGGKGCDAAIDTIASSPDCYTGGVFVPSARGTNDRFVDHMFGGVGGPTSGGKKDVQGSDIMDWRPRGPFATCTANPFPTDIGTTSVDPCSWFQMTNTDDDTAAPATLLNNQHHQGTDWMYGGWDRDVMQGDVAANGPNPGDRMLDWDGAYNLYTHCNPAYGGFNDVRQHSPAMQDFLQQVSFSDGAGQAAADSATSATSGYRELALAYPGEAPHSAGPAFPSTPGHFDVPSCSD